jgi:hypothetical protein
MRWFLPITAATCAVVVAVLVQALPGSPSPARSERSLYGGSTRCLGDPAWFAPIHEYYDCNPRITPDFDFASLYFDFASLYSPVVRRETAPSSQAMPAAPANRADRLEAGFTEAAASVTNRIGDLQTFQLINTGSGTVSGFGTATVVVGITQDRSVTPCGPGSWTNAATRRIVLGKGVLVLREASIACPTASGPVITGTYEVDGLSSTGIFAGAQGSGDLTVNVSSATATISGKLKLAGSSDD